MVLKYHRAISIQTNNEAIGYPLEVQT